MQTGCTWWSFATTCSLPAFLYLHMIESIYKGPIWLICWISPVSKEHLRVTFSTEMGLAWVCFLMLQVVVSKLDSCLIFQKNSCIMYIIHTGMPDRWADNQIQVPQVAGKAYKWNPYIQCLACFFSSLERHFSDLSPIVLAASLLLYSWEVGMKMSLFRSLIHGITWLMQWNGSHYSLRTLHKTLTSLALRTGGERHLDLGCW